MKILLTTSYANHTGGLQSHIETLKDSLLKENYEVDIVQPSYSKTLLVKFLIKNCLSVLKLRILNNSQEFMFKLRLMYLEHFFSKLNLTEYGIVHSHDVSATAFLLDRHPCVLSTVHGPFANEYLAQKRADLIYNKILDFEKETLLKVRKIIAVDTGQAEIVKNYGVSSDRISIILNIPDSSFLISKDIEKSFKSKNLFVPRRLVKKNGVDVAIKALKHLPGFTLLIAGDGPEKSSLQEIAETNLVSDRVTFLGALKKERVIERLSDVFAVIIPSVPYNGVIEASSIAALESMASGCLTIASNIGGLCEIIQDGKTGMLFEAGDEMKMVEKIEEIKNHFPKYKFISESSREDIEKNFSPKKWINSIKDVYASLID